MKKQLDNKITEVLTAFAIDGGTITKDTDTDGDGLKDYQEKIIYKTDRLDTDTDDDGMPDCWEVAYGLDSKRDDASDDFDRDGVSNLIEYRRGTDQTDPDDYPSGAMPWIPLLLFDNE